MANHQLPTPTAPTTPPQQQLIPQPHLQHDPNCPYYGTNRPVMRLGGPATGGIMRLGGPIKGGAAAGVKPVVSRPTNPMELRRSLMGNGLVRPVTTTTAATTSASPAALSNKMMFFGCCPIPPTLSLFEMAELRKQARLKKKKEEEEARKKKLEELNCDDDEEDDYVY